MKILIDTLGCKVNQYDSYAFKASVEASGHEFVNNVEDADMVALFACAVTKNACKQARQVIRKYKQINANIKIYVSGCYSRLWPNEIKELKVENLSDFDFQNSGEDVFPVKQSRAKAFLKIQDGCSNECHYCVIRLARGKSISADPEQIVANAISLIKQGFREIIICGIHIGSYGQDLVPKIKLSDLIKKLLNETTDARFRLSSLHPHEVDDEIVSLLNHPRICRYLHLSVQSGSDNVLRLMNRRPARKKIEDVVSKINENDQNIFIASDIIVGYPGESEDDFQETFDLASSFPFSWLHVFPFSPRPGTKAFELKTLPAEIVKRRSKKMLELAGKKRKEFVASQIGKELEVVVISDANKDGTVKATSDNYIDMILPSERKYREKGRAVGEKIKGFELWANWK